MKKLAIFMMIIAFAAIICTVSASAATIDSGACGENISWVLDDSGCLTISGTGAMEDYENDTDQPWYDYKYPGLNTAIQKLVIEEGVTRIGNNAFRYCGQILEVSLPNTLERIGDYAFYGVSQLPEINFPSSLRTIGANAFEKCYGFTKIEIPYGVEEVGSGAFAGIGYGLKEVSVSEGNIGASAFSNNYGLENVILGEDVVSIGQMAFFRCESIKEIAIPESVGYIGAGAFKGCSALEKISFSGGAYIDESAFDVGSTSETPTGCDVYIPNMQVWYDMTFANASANPLYADGKLYVDGALLTELVVPSDLWGIGHYSFANCAELKTVTLEDGVGKIRDGAFGGCDDLEKITIPESVNSIGSDAFAKCAKLTVYGTPFSAAEAYCTINSVPFVGAASEGIISSGTCGDGLAWALSDDEVLTIYGTGKMYDYSFADPAPWNSSKENIKSVIIKSGVTYIGKCAFENCANIEGVTIPKSVTSIGKNAFRGCTNLTIYGYWHSTAQTYANENSIAFSLLSENGILASGACGDKLSWMLDEEGELKIYGIGKMDDYSDENPAPWNLIRDKIKTVVLDEGVMNIGDNAFAFCENLTGISISVSVTNIGDDAFLDCSGLIKGYYNWNQSDADKKWGRIFIEAGNEQLTNVNAHHFAPYVGYIVSSERVYDAETDEYYLQMTLICEDGKFVVKTAEDIKNFDSELYDFTGELGEIKKNQNFAPGTFAEFTVNYEGKVERLDNRNTKRISKIIQYGEESAKEGLYLVNVTKERNGVLYCINANIDITLDAAAYANAIANAYAFDLWEADYYDCIGIDGDEYRSTSLTKLSSRGDTLVDGVGNAVIQINAAGEIRRVFSFWDNYILENAPIEYSFAQSVQIGLIEPWFLKANARAYTDENPINIDYSTLIDYGAYFIRASELENVNAAPETLTAEDIINDADSIKCSKKSGTATVDGSYITASYDKGLYTYEMGDSIFVLFYIEDANGIQYLPIRERNMKELLEKRKNDTENFANALERNVYTAMDKLELDIGAYRAQFAKIEELPKQAAPMLSEYVEKNGAFEDETVKNYTFKNSVQLILVEPWGLKVNSRVFDDANPININYDSVEEFGAIVYYDTEGEIESMTAEELRTKSDAYVFSSKNGDAAVDGSYITALYNKDIFTYQLDSNAYVMFYIKDADGYHYGDVKIRNAYELAKERAQDTSGNFGEKEKTVYQDMVAMYEAVKAYRDDYFENN